MKESLNEKPQAPADTEAQGDKVKSDKKDYTLDICPCPATPNGCYHITKLDAENYKLGAGTYDLGVHFFDWDDGGDRPTLPRLGY